MNERHCTEAQDRGNMSVIGYRYLEHGSAEARVSSRQPQPHSQPPSQPGPFTHTFTNNASTAVNMGKAGKRGHDEVDTYEEDDFVENDDGAARKTKKTKSAASSSNDQDKFWELSKGSKPRRVTISDFKGNTLINIREFYDKDGKFLPGSKGLSLTIDQYKNLLHAIPSINKYLKGQGVDVSASAISYEESEEDVPKRRIKAKKEAKANIEATSEEDNE
ncbi:transcriptional Coactivator p15-domain-containing protein [Cadophora sp. MPI-SDFR-AT-0126]|nr:transcriptional Coactivator p15-domain-containing protein [Leotiomycetes sp. MPI-SDFR-AT-0126]